MSFEESRVESLATPLRLVGTRSTDEMQPGAMTSARPISSMQAIGARSVLATVARIVWHLVRLPLLALLTLLEPAVRAVFSLAMVLGVLAATVFELSAAGPRFEFLQMFAGSLGFGVALLLYYGLLALVSR